MQQGLEKSVACRGYVHLLSIVIQARRLNQAKQQAL